MGDDVVKVLLAKLADMDRKLAALVADRSFDSKVPLVLREAAEVCHVELEWLRERVKYKDIPAYRSTGNGSWRVFPADVKKFVMQETNQRPARRKSVLRNVV